MMVEQMVNSKLSKYGLGRCESILTSCDKQPVVAIKNTALREVQNVNRTGLPETLGNSASQRGTESSGAATQVVIAKSSIPETLVSSPRLQSPGSTNVNQHLVYARRRLDAELVTCRNSDKNHSADYQQSEQLIDKRANPQPQANMDEPNSDGPTAFARIPVNSTVSSLGSGNTLHDSTRKRDHGQSTVVNPVPSSDDSQVKGDQHWRERFIQLQKYLKHCDNSNQEAYIKKLRSFTSDECSRHAVELERRAIYLMLEEGREIQRMKDLMILGKSAANNSVSPLTPIVKSEKQ